MATFLDAEKDLLAEVRGRITDLVPEREATIRFRHRSEEARKRKTFEEAERKTRLFEIGIATLGNVHHVGRDARAYYYYYPIRIMYPSGSEHWNGAATSDVERIIHDLDRYATSVSGVQNRVIDSDQKPEIIIDPDDPWMEARLILRVHYDISGN